MIGYHLLRIPQVGLRDPCLFLVGIRTWQSDVWLYTLRPVGWRSLAGICYIAPIIREPPWSHMSMDFKNVGSICYTTKTRYSIFCKKNGVIWPCKGISSLQSSVGCLNARLCSSRLMETKRPDSIDNRVTVIIAFTVPVWRHLLQEFHYRNITIHVCWLLLVDSINVKRHKKRYGAVFLVFHTSSLSKTKWLHLFSQKEGSMF